MTAELVAPDVTVKPCNLGHCPDDCGEYDNNCHEECNNVQPEDWDAAVRLVLRAYRATTELGWRGNIVADMRSFLREHAADEAWG